MPVSVPSYDEFQAQAEQLAALEARVAALEQGTKPDPPPDGASMVATIRASVTPYHGAGPFEYREADGEELGTYHDPAGRFAVTLTRVTCPGCDIVVDFMRYRWGTGFEEATAVLQRGTVSADNLNSLNQVIRGARFGPYSVEITGDFTMSASTTEHYDGSEWRVCSWGAADQWPFPLTPIADLQAAGIVGHYDAELAAFCAPATAGMRYEPMQQTNGKNATPGYVCALRLLGGSTGVDSAIGLEGDEVSAYLGGQPNMRGSVLEQAEAYHIYPWMRIDPATGAPIKLCGQTDLFLQGQIFNSGYRPISLMHQTTTQATIHGPANCPMPAAHVIASTGDLYNVLNMPKALDPNGTATINIQSPGSPYLPTDPAALLEPAVDGCSVTISNAAYNTAEGDDGISIDANHTPNGGFLPFMLTGDPYHLKSVQAKAGWTRAASGWGITRTGVEWVTKDGFAIMSSRRQAWQLRDIAEAVIATPDDVPNWLLPRDGFVYALQQMKEAYLYRWDNPVNVGGPVTNMIEVHAGLTTAGSMYHDYLSLACVRALVADPSWSTWVDRAVRNLTGRFDAASGWCNTVPAWYAGLDFRNCQDWSEAWDVLVHHPAYTEVGGVCPAELAFHTSGDVNTLGLCVWLYAAMTRLRQIGYGGDAFGVAYEAFVPAFRQAILAGQFGPAPLGWKFCFAP